MTLVVVTTDTNYVYLPEDFFVIDSNATVPLRVNSTGAFTLAFALWPYIGLISLIMTVWLLVYLSSILSRRRHPKHGHRSFTSFYVSRDSTIGVGVVGHDAATAVSPLDV